MTQRLPCPACGAPLFQRYGYLSRDRTTINRRRDCDACGLRVRTREEIVGPSRSRARAGVRGIAQRSPESPHGAEQTRMEMP